MREAAMGSLPVILRRFMTAILVLLVFAVAVHAEDEVQIQE